MIEGNVFRKTVVSNQHKSGRTVKKFVKRVCDSCNVRDEIRFDHYQKTRRREGMDLCKECANKYPYRQMPTGKSHGSWKHGITTAGYERTTIKGKRILKHVAIFEEKLGRPLTETERVHHINMNKRDNRFENLHLCRDSKEHRKVHWQMQRLGFSLLGKLIFFDRKHKTYSIEPISHKNNWKPPIINKNLYVKTDPRTNASYCFFSLNGKHVRYHVWLMEQKHKRKLQNSESVHHIDGNTLNNDPSNLCLLQKGVHSACHQSLERAIAELYKKGLVEFDKQKGVYKEIGNVHQS